MLKLNNIDSTTQVIIKASSDIKERHPNWFAEVVIFIESWKKSGLLSKVQDQIRVERGRMGTYDTCDFVENLLSYGISGDPTLKEFYKNLNPIKEIVANLWNRDKLPSRSALSRFLKDVKEGEVENLRHLLFSEFLKQGLSGDLLGGLKDRQGQQHLIFDIDMTREAARRRALVGDEIRPRARRRTEENFAPGYRGRKRGEVVQSRTVLQQGHTHEWLGTWNAKGNGKVWDTLDWACKAVIAYMQFHHLDVKEALLRLDGAYGWAKGAAKIRGHQLGYIMRCVDYRLLDRSQIQERLRSAEALPYIQIDSGKKRLVYDLGEMEWESGEDPSLSSQMRLIVGISDAPADNGKVKVGKRIGKKVYELFATERIPEGLSAVDILSLYFARGGFERRLWEEDQEQNPDRWCSQNLWGQEFWQLLSQHVWNMRLSLGAAAEKAKVRKIEWAKALEPRENDESSEKTSGQGRENEPCDPEKVTIHDKKENAQTDRDQKNEREDETSSTCQKQQERSDSPADYLSEGNIRSEDREEIFILTEKHLYEQESQPEAANVMPRENLANDGRKCNKAEEISLNRVIKQSEIEPDDQLLNAMLSYKPACDWGRGAGKISARCFTVTAHEKMLCPMNKEMHLAERRKEKLHIRKIYRAKAQDCSSCKKRGLCLGHGSSGKQGRRVSLICPEVTSTRVYTEKSTALGSPVSDRQISGFPPKPVGKLPVYMMDIESTRLRRVLPNQLRRQQVDIELYKPCPLEIHAESLITRDQIAHRRLTWAERLARNASKPGNPIAIIHLHGIPQIIKNSLMNSNGCRAPT